MPAPDVKPAHRNKNRADEIQRRIDGRQVSDLQEGGTSNVQGSTSNVQFQKDRARLSSCAVELGALGVARFLPSASASSRTDASSPRPPVLSPSRKGSPLAIASHFAPGDRRVRSHLRLDELVSR